MSDYIKTVWAPGDLITAAKLQNAENGIEAAHQEIAQLSVDKIGRGAGNQSVEQVISLILAGDTRSMIPTAWNADNKPTSIEIRDGVTVVSTIGLTYNADNRPTQMVVTAGGKTITYTVTWTGDRWDGTTKAVV